MLTWLWGDSYLWRETETIKGAILEMNSEVPVKPLADTAPAVFTIHTCPGCYLCWACSWGGAWTAQDGSVPAAALKSSFLMIYFIMSVLPACSYVFQVCTWYSQRPEKGIGFPGVGIIGGCALPHGCWESD